MRSFESRSKGALESVIKSKECVDAKSYFRSGEEQDGDFGPIPEAAYDSIVSQLQKETTDEDKQGVKNALATITHTVEEAVKQLFPLAISVKRKQYMCLSMP